MGGFICMYRRVSADQGRPQEVGWHVWVHPLRLLFHFLPIGMYVCMYVKDIYFYMTCMYLPYVCIHVFSLSHQEYWSLCIYVHVWYQLCQQDLQFKCTVCMCVVLVECRQVSRSCGAHASIPVDRRFQRWDDQGAPGRLGTQFDFCFMYMYVWIHDCISCAMLGWQLQALSLPYNHELLQDLPQGTQPRQSCRTD